jgi:hypothetical protein
MKVILGNVNVAFVSKRFSNNIQNRLSHKIIINIETS